MFAGATLRAAPTTALNPESPVYSVNDLGRRPDPSVNILNLRGALSWSHLDLALYLDNALDTRPTLTLRNLCRRCTLFYATTLRPRTLGLAGTWRF
jgi:outer membrane receptor protein involved in Fe transport